MHDIKGKSAVITGAASGIGKAIATAFVEAGASVLLCDVNARALARPSASSGAAPSAALPTCLTRATSKARCARRAVVFGSLDIVVNCAGFGAITPLIELTAEKWQAVQAVTLGGVFYGVKHGARQMLEQGRPA